MFRRGGEVHRITTMDVPATPEQARRQRTYLIMMGIRAAAVVAAVMVPGAWRWVAIVAGVTLPYFAVVLANAVHTRGVPRIDFDALPPDDQPPALDGPRHWRA